MTYQECDKALRKYHCYFKRKKSNKQFDIEASSIDIEYQSTPKDNTTKPKGQNTNNCSPELDLDRPLAVRPRPIPIDIGNIDTECVNEFKFTQNYNNPNWVVPFPVVRIIYQLASTPIRERTKSQGTIAIQSILQLAKKVNYYKKHKEAIKNSDLINWIKQTMINIENNRPVAKSAEHIDELSQKVSSNKDKGLKIPHITGTTKSSSHNKVNKVNENPFNLKPQPVDIKQRQANDKKEAAKNRRAMDQMDPADQLKEEEKMSNLMHQKDRQKITDNHNNHNQHENKAMTDYEHYSDLTLQRLHHRKFANAHFSPADLVSVCLNKGRYSLNYQAPLHNYDNIIATAYSHTVDEFKADPKFQVASDGSLILKQGTKLMSANTVLIVNVQDSKSHAKVLKELKQSGMLHAYNSINKNIADSDSILAKYIVTDNCLDYLASLNNWHNIAQGTFECEMARISDDAQLNK